MKNGFVKALWAAAAIQAFLIVISIRESVVSGIAFLLLLCSFVPTVVLGVLCIKRAKSPDVNRGKKTGIFFTAVNAVGLILSVVLVVSFFTFNSDSLFSEKEIEKGIDFSSHAAVEDLRGSLKDPTSLKINRIAARVYDTRINWQASDGTVHSEDEFKGFYRIYIDYTAENGLGGVARGRVMYEFDEKFNLKNRGEIEKMPQENDETFELSESEF